MIPTVTRAHVLPYEKWPRAREFYDYLRGGILAHGLLRLGCDTCHHELLVPCRGTRRGFGPSCAGRRMAQTAAHLVAQVLPWGLTRQWGGQCRSRCATRWPRPRN
jgi:hypothetical protein